MNKNGRVGIVETQPHRKTVGEGNKDGTAYVYPDSGCEEATLYLGWQSLCLACPFPECSLEKLKKGGRKKK